MIKNLRYLCTLLLIAVASVAWGQSQSSLVFTAKCGGVGTADDGASWVVSSDAQESNFDSTKGVHFGTGKLAVSYLELSTSDIEGTITKIVVNASGASGTSASLGVTVGGVDFGSTQSLTSTATEYTFEGSASGEIKVRLSQASATKALYVKSIVVTYNNGAVTELLDPELAFVTTSATITLGDEFVLPELTNKGDGAVTYSSSNQNVATVDDNGIVDVKGAGTTVITAKSALTETYKAGSADFTLTVNNAPIVIVDGTYDFTGTEAYGSGLTPSTDNGYIGNATTWTAGNVTLVAEGKYRWWYNANGNTLRFYVPKDETDEYNAGSMTISVPEGKVITKIVITGGKAFEANVGTYENGTWTGSNNSVVLTCTSNSYVETVTVTYGDGDEPPVVVVPVPTFNPAAGEVEAGTTVEIICPDGADGVEYSFDQSNWTEYKTPIEITEATTIFAQAYDEEGNYSEVVSAAYTIKQDVPGPGEYETVAVPYTVDFTQGQDKFVVEDVANDLGVEIWTQGSSYGMTATSYVQLEGEEKKSNHDGESWLVSPIIDLSENTAASLAVTDQVNKFFGDYTQELGIFVREENGNWNKLDVTYSKPSNTWGGWEDRVIDLTSYVGKKIQIGFYYKGTETSAGTYELKSFSVTAEEPVIKKDAELSYSVSTFTATIGEDVEFPILNNPNELEGITYSSSHDDVATVDENGTVTLVAAGQTTIKASFGGNTEFKQGDASYMLIVKEEEVAGKDKFELVKDATDLKVDDVIIIAFVGDITENEVTTSYSYALSTTQNANNRAAYEVTVNEDGTITPGSTIQQITLEDGWYFNVGDGYLYAASSKSNWLRTEADANDNAKADISIIENGDATIIFQGENTRNHLRFNPNTQNGAPLFSCYSEDSSLALPQIYRKVTSAETHSGNVNGDPDGKVDIADVTALVNIIVNNSDLTPEQLAAGDFDDSGTLTVEDVEALVNKILGNQ
jgi:hypothetical protein